jgi:integrase
LKGQHGLADGKPVYFPDSYYALRSYEGKRQVFKRLGSDASQALADLNREQRRLNARLTAADAEDMTLVDRRETRIDLYERKDAWLDRLRTRGKTRAAETMAISIGDFLQITGHRYADELTEDSIIEFYAGLRKRGKLVRHGRPSQNEAVTFYREGDISDRTVFNKSADIAGWCRWMGLDVKSLIGEKVNYTKSEVEIYEPEEMAALFAACGPGYHRVVYQTLLMSGMRDEEAANLRWINVDFKREEIRVREDKELAFTIKDRERRSIPVPQLMPILHAWRKERPDMKLVLGTSKDRPNGKWLENLRRIVRQARMNCGDCIGCRKNSKCRRWWLHKFRATFTTNMLRSGLDARTVMDFTGHADIATVMKYWAPLKAASAKERISSITWS